MGRKKSSSTHDLLNLVALLPWWLGVALAGVSHLVLHSFANPAQIGALHAGNAGAFAVRAMIVGLANAGQYVLPSSALSVHSRRFCIVANGKQWSPMWCRPRRIKRALGFHGQPRLS
jgi:restriction system protein